MPGHIQRLANRNIQRFGFDAETQLFTVGDEQLSAWDLISYREPEQVPDIKATRTLYRTEGLVIDSSRQLYQLPRLGEWFLETPFEEKQAVFDAATTAVNMVYNTVYNVPEPFKLDTGYGFYVSEDEGTLDVTMCTHITIFVPADERYTLEREGFVEYTTNNVDIPIDGAVLLAGAAVVADACRVKLFR